MQKSTAIFMAAATLSLAAFSANATQTEPGVCARLAPQLGLKQQPAKRGMEGPAPWRVNMLSGVSATLFGGSFNATFSVEPLEGVPPLPGQNFNEMCKQQGGNMTCSLSGPLRVKIGTKAGEATTDLSADERAVVGVEGRHLTCQDS